MRALAFKNIFDINFSFKCILLCNHPLCFFSLLTLLKLPKGKSKFFLGKRHIPDLGIKPVSWTLPTLAGGISTISTTWEAPENTWIIFKHCLILISNIIPQLKGNRLCITSISLDHEHFALCFMYLYMF